MKNFLGILLMIAVFGLASFDASSKVRGGKKSSPPESQPQTEAPVSPSPPAETRPTGGLGSVIFYLNEDESPQSQPGSVHVEEKDRVYFCVQLKHDEPRIRRVLKYLRGVEFTLLGPGDNPQKIVGATRFLKRGVQPDAGGCYRGSFRVPEGIPPGKYKVSEVDLWQAPSASVSLREELKEFSRLGVVEVDSPVQDPNPPIIEKIVNWTPLVDHLLYGGKIGHASMNFRVITTDLISGIQPESFHIFFKIFLDGVLVDILEPKCFPRLKNLYYDCKLYFSRALPDLRAVTVKIVLDSIGLSDRFGNNIEINDSEKLKSFFDGKLLGYTFYPTRSAKKKATLGQDKEEDLVKWPPVVKPSDGDQQSGDEF